MAWNGISVQVGGGENLEFCCEILSFARLQFYLFSVVWKTGVEVITDLTGRVIGLGRVNQTCKRSSCCYQ